MPAEDFLLGRVLADAPALRIEFERVVPTDDHVFPYFWVVGDALDAFDAAMANDDTVTAFEPLDVLENRALYRAQWDLDGDGLLWVLGDLDLALLEASGTADTWRFKVRFPHAEQLTTFRDRCDQAGVALALSRLYDTVDADLDRQRPLTDSQHSLLEFALERGYFEVPRRTSLVEMADDLGISDQSVSERLRRGLRNLLETSLEQTRQFPDQ